jgi:hypothetical protein
MNLYMMLAGGRHYLIAARRLSSAMRIAADLVQDLEVEDETRVEDARGRIAGVTLQEAGVAPANMVEGPVNGSRL